MAPALVSVPRVERVPLERLLRALASAAPGDVVRFSGVLPLAQPLVVPAGVSLLGSKRAVLRAGPSAPEVGVILEDDASLGETRVSGFALGVRMDGGVLAGVRLDACGTGVRACGAGNLVSDTTIAGCERAGIEIMPDAHLRLVTSEIADAGTAIDVGAGALDACELVVTGATDGLRLGAGSAALFRARIRQCRRAGIFVDGRRATLRCNASPWEPGLTLSDNGTDILDARGPDAPGLVLAGVVHA